MGGISYLGTLFFISALIFLYTICFNKDKYVVTFFVMAMASGILAVTLFFISSDTRFEKLVLKKPASAMVYTTVYDGPWILKLDEGKKVYIVVGNKVFESNNCLTSDLSSKDLPKFVRRNE